MLTIQQKLIRIAGLLRFRGKCSVFLIHWLTWDSSLAKEKRVGTFALGLSLVIVEVIHVALCRNRGTTLLQSRKIDCTKEGVLFESCEIVISALSSHSESVSWIELKKFVDDVYTLWFKLIGDEKLSLFDFIEDFKVNLPMERGLADSHFINHAA